MNPYSKMVSGTFKGLYGDGFFKKMRECKDNEISYGLAVTNKELKKKMKNNKLFKLMKDKK